MGSKNSGKRKTKEVETPVLKPQGSGINKRTPQSSFDPASGNDIYEAETVVGERV